MITSAKSTLMLLLTALGISSLDFKCATFAKRYSRKRDRTGNVTISTRSTPICFAVNDPNAPLPTQFRVGRSKRSKDFFLLESEGLLDTTVKFSIADRKSLGIKNKSRQTLIVALL
jgi:hypothetical protein